MDAKQLLEIEAEIQNLQDAHYTTRVAEIATIIKQLSPTTQAQIICDLFQRGVGIGLASQ